MDYDNSGIGGYRGPVATVTPVAMAAGHFRPPPQVTASQDNAAATPVDHKDTFTNLDGLGLCRRLLE